MRLFRVVATLVAVALVAVFVPVVEVGAQPGAPTLTGYPQGTIGSDNAAFSFHASGADSYQCRVFDTGTAEECPARMGQLHRVDHRLPPGHFPTRR
ncbi:MAG: hypothetical protein R2714_16455 [Microthrixaceae bacterium]